jgi:hypothetical protein
LKIPRGKLGLLGFGHSIIVKVEIGNNRESVRAAIQSLSVDWGEEMHRYCWIRHPNYFPNKPFVGI